ncbi:cysteine desulfurase-like protein [Sphingosinicella sp. CPCC 101087]|uniref:cysteine desulfurase-like protein n=1 Tax=Sphingosinicella sp. CPCC 101087 TaxID=2497754 RepID=UPI00101CBE87|nr:cysteine desulfurase-like protein [Sphingosinicella sp. CPCC 101087]
MNFPIDQVREEFPALAVRDGNEPRIYFDAPGGTQACRRAIMGMAGHLERGTANAGGAFTTSTETDAMSSAAHAAAADLLGGDPGEIAFGPNMTSLTLAVSRSLARDWQAGDEIVLSRLDHDANVWPWAMAAADRGVAVRWLDFDPETVRLDLDALPGLIGRRTRLVAVGGASNALGTLNDVAEIARIVRAGSDALLFVDAVQSVPHVATDVRALGCDLLVCSPYKSFGPHLGVLWGRAELMAGLTAYKVRPASTEPPAVRFETGTPSFEAQAGLIGTIDYLEWLGRTLSDKPPLGRRAALIAAMDACVAYEWGLGERLLEGLSEVGAKLYGPGGMDGRVPTFGFTMEGHRPDAVAETLARHRINAWSGHFYAVEPVKRLRLWDSGGLVRVGLCHYSTMAEVERLIEVLGDIAERRN